jgi:hypothetical protein
MITLGWRWALFALGRSAALIDELTSVFQGNARTEVNTDHEFRPFEW